jgi:hypothetical protein
VYDHAGRTFTLLGDSDRARCHSRFHPAIRLAGWLSMTEFYRSCFQNITLTTACYDHVAPPDPVSGRGGRACSSCQMLTGCCPNPLAIALRVMLPESSLVLMNISHLRCGPVGVRFIESRFAGRHKCRPYKVLKRKFLYYQVIKREVTLLCKLDLGNSLLRPDPLFPLFFPSFCALTLTKMYDKHRFV